MSDFWIGFIVISVYIIGWFVYCFLNKSSIGTMESDYEGEYMIDTMDVVMMGLFWPFMLFIIILLSPIKIMEWIINHVFLKNS